jgi:hypothetical protein
MGRPVELERFAFDDADGSGRFDETLTFAGTRDDNLVQRLIPGERVCRAKHDRQQSGSRGRKPANWVNHNCLP